MEAHVVKSVPHTKVAFHSKRFTILLIYVEEQLIDDVMNTNCPRRQYVQRNEQVLLHPWAETHKR